MKKLRLGILFGGQSAEHEVSLQTARNVVDAVNKDKYDITLIGIDKDGVWNLQDASDFLLNEINPSLIALNRGTESVTLLPYKKDKQLLNLKSKNLSALDAIFPLLHGTFGEDGTIQGLLKLAHIPYVGADVLGSAIGMDKDITKRLLRDAGIPITKFKCLRKDDLLPSFSDMEKSLGNPFFIKPVNAGSSIGVSKISTENEFKKAVKLALSYDNKILIEKAINGREIEFALLGNENPIISVPGEIIVNDDFYSYDAKYINSKNSSLQIPAQIPNDIIQKMQKIALKTFKVLACEGMARIDMFLTAKHQIFVNEINTIPGFTKISMYPKLWEASGITYSELIDKLIQLALDRYDRDSKLKTTITPNS